MATAERTLASHAALLLLLEEEAPRAQLRSLRLTPCHLEIRPHVFPPLKSAVGGVLALRDIAERAKHSKSDARDIADRTIKILAVIASTVPDRSVIPQLLQSRIESLTDLLDEVRSSMETLAHTGGVSRLVHLNRNEGILQSIKARLDDEYRGFLIASALQVEAQQAELAKRQTEITKQQTEITKQQTEITKQQAQLADQQLQLSIQQAHMHQDVSAKTDALMTLQSSVLFHSRLSVFLAFP
ncbi:hypothetical protein MVEN_00263200 [Mycena venus]|uniref:Uncharacterized protein n=1 Tax=Mycena venus TaxID=2733690 RepID=A0A8H6Z2W5_9AGAR|nr:hypothetical protein MVEN_00263200 [Mycena venus]